MLTPNERAMLNTISEYMRVKSFESWTGTDDITVSGWGPALIVYINGCVLARINEHYVLLFVGQEDRESMGYLNAICEKYEIPRILVHDVLGGWWHSDGKVELPFNIGGWWEII